MAVERVTEYAGEDADATLRIEEILSAKVRSEGLVDAVRRARAAR